MAYDAYKVAQAFERMFRVCPLPLKNDGTPNEAQKLSAMYLEACEGYTTRAIVDACEDFTFGRVEGVNRSWAPNLPNFTAHLRRVQNGVSATNRLLSQGLKQIEAREREEAEIEQARTPEAMQRVRELMEGFKQSVNPDTRTAEEVAEMKEALRKTDQHFASDYIETESGIPVSRSLLQSISTYNSADDDSRDMGDLR